MGILDAELSELRRQMLHDVGERGSRGGEGEGDDAGGVRREDGGHGLGVHGGCRLVKEELELRQGAAIDDIRSAAKVHDGPADGQRSPVVLGKVEEVAPEGANLRCRCNNVRGGPRW